MKIDNNKIGPNNTYFVIEEGQANLGDFEKALKMIDVAAKTGANAIEFQLAQADDFYIKSHAGHQLYKQREFSDYQLKELVKYSKERSLVTTFLSPFIFAFCAVAIKQNNEIVNSNIFFIVLKLIVLFVHIRE